MSDYDVIIIGSGPTGATLALSLAKAGSKVLLVEREKDIYPLPRAVHIDDEIMRIFQGLGLAEAILPHTYPAPSYEFRTAKGEVLLGFTTDPTHQPLGWYTSNMIHQPSIEQVLQSAINAHDGITQMRGWSFMKMIEQDDHISVTVSDGNSENTISAQYLVGCDGARSPVRTAANIDIDDLKFSEPWLVIDTIVSDPTRLHRGNLQICDPARPTTSIPVSRTRHRWEFMLKEGETAEQALTDDFIAPLLQPWNVDGAITIERRAVYTFKAILAKQWRKGRVLIAGDAAHQMPPFAGQGMCSGLRDAANIAWKLQAVVNDGSASDLLDSYQMEREPNVRAIVEMALMMGKTVCITDPVAAAHRDAKMLADRANGAGADAGGFNFPPIIRGVIQSNDAKAGHRLPQPQRDGHRLDDILGAGACLLTRRPLADLNHQLVHVADLDSPSLAPFAAGIEQWTGALEHGHSVLIRPDKYVFGVGDAATLIADYAQVLQSGNAAHYGTAPLPKQQEAHPA
jgi:3-(3-hydroxy-phenyl)propionate hydroxylase